MGEAMTHEPDFATTRAQRLIELRHAAVRRHTETLIYSSFDAEIRQHMATVVLLDSVLGEQARTAGVFARVEELTA